jgi:hypothetical protein
MKKLPVKPIKPSASKTENYRRNNVAKAKQEPSEVYVSGEQYQQMRGEGSEDGKKVTVTARSVTMAGIVIVVFIIGFLGGMAYQKGHTKHAAAVVSSSGSSGSGGPGSGGFRRRSGGIGQVTAVSPTSITISNTRTGASSTYAITGSTTITDNGQAVTTSDIQAGSTVLVMTSASDTSTATSILVNPSFGGGASGGATAPGAAGSATN